MLGVVRGAMVPITLLVLLEAPGFDRQKHGLVGGRLFVAGEIGGVLGPVAIGYLSAGTGAFSTSLSALALLALGALVLVTVLMRVERRQNR